MTAPWIPYASSRTKRSVRAFRQPAWSGGLRIAWTIIAIAVIGGGAAFITQGFSQLLGVLSPIFLVLALVAAAVLFSGLRRSWDATARGISRTGGAPQPPRASNARAAESTERAAVRRQLARLRTQIEHGTSIGQSLSKTLPALPERIAGLILAAEKSGVWPPHSGASSSTTVASDAATRCRRFISAGIP